MKKAFSAPTKDEETPRDSEATVSRFARAYQAQFEEEDELGDCLPASPFERPKRKE